MIVNSHIDGFCEQVNPKRKINLQKVGMTWELSTTSINKKICERIPIYDAGCNKFC